MPLFSVIIPVFNRAHLIAATLESVLRQQCQDFEILVVDDGSTDDLTSSLAPYLSSITLLRQPNRGPGAARNHGITQARGDYICFLDSDDVWFPWTLDLFARTIAEAGRPSFLRGGAVWFENAQTLSAVRQEPFQSQQFNDYLSASPLPLWVGMCAVAIRSGVLRSVGAFHEQRINGEDSDLWLRLGTSPGFVVISSPPLFGCRRHAVSEIQDLRKTSSGMFHLIKQEQTGHYPGGSRRQLARREIITRHVRPASLALVRQGFVREGFQLFALSFAWHLRAARLRYLLAFPLIGLFAAMGRMFGRTSTTP